MVAEVVAKTAAAAAVEAALEVSEEVVAAKAATMVVAEPVLVELEGTDKGELPER